MKNKGFTLVELLVTISILGIIMGMSIPLIRSIKARLDQQKYDAYGKSMVTSAKVYNDSYEMDLFGRKITGCTHVPLAELIDHNLMKDFPDKKITCISDNTVVRIIKLNKQYGYSYYLYCANNNIDFDLKSSSLSKKEKKVPEEDELCKQDISMNISATITSGDYAESHNPQIKLTSLTGINDNIDIKYAWTNSKNITDELVWKSIKFKLPANQEDSILNKGKMITSLSKNIEKTPKEPDSYYLIIRVDTYDDLYGEHWQGSSEEVVNDKYLIFGPYNVQNIHRLTYHLNGGKGCSPNYKETYRRKDSPTPTWGELCKPTRNDYSFEGWYTNEDGSGEIVTEETVATKDIDVYAKWQHSNVKVIFDPNITGHSKGEISFTEKTVTPGKEYGELPTGTRTLYGFDAYELEGWYTKASGGTKITDTTKVELDTEHTLYAHWNDKAVSIGSYMNCKRVIDIKGGSMAQKTEIRTWPQNNTLAQKWYITDNSDGTVYFKSAKDNSWCMDIPGGTVESEAKIRLWGCNNSNAQKFVIKEYDDNVVAIQTASNKNFCLNVRGANLLKNNQLQLWNFSKDEASLWYSKCPNDKTAPTCNPARAKEYDDSGNTYQAGCSDTGSGCTIKVQNFVATFTTNNVNQTVTIFDRAGNETQCPATYICADVIYKDGTTCSKTCGGGTKNRLAYARSNQSHRCKNKDLASGGSACNTQSCCSTSNPTGCPKKHACRVGMTRIFESASFDSYESIVYDSQTLYVISQSGSWSKVYTGRNALSSSPYAWIRSYCLRNVGVSCAFADCPDS